MPRYIALLRAVNVGGRNVRMEELRALFESIGLKRVESFIASGNLIFESPSNDEKSLREKIENRMQKALGYEVDTFLRTVEEIAAVADNPPFPVATIEKAEAFVVGFLHEPLSAEGQDVLKSLRTDIDEFATSGREIYWLCKKKQSESTFSNAVFERRAGVRATFRGMSTVRKMSARYGAD